MRNASVPRTDDGPRRGRIATRRTASARAPQLAGTPQHRSGWYELARASARRRVRLQCVATSCRAAAWRGTAGARGVAEPAGRDGDTL